MGSGNRPWVSFKPRFLQARRPECGRDTAGICTTVPFLLVSISEDLRGDKVKRAEVGNEEGQRGTKVMDRPKGRAD